MTASFTRLSLPAQTVYAQLVDSLLTSETGYPAEGATLVSKRIKGHTYWYVQRTSDGRRSQTYLGRETPEVLGVIDRWRTARAQAANRAELVAIARAGGLHAVAAAEARVLTQLAYAFRIGAVLIGSHAFAVLGNMLGVHWQEAVVRTDDVDLAHDPTIAVAMSVEIEPPQMTDAIGATPLFSVLEPTSPATSFQVRGTTVQVDLLTPMVGKERRAPIQIPALGAAALPLRFLDYLIEESQPAAIVGGEGVLVNVPRPGRFAFHKLLVAGRRTTSSKTKANKDRAQGAALLRVLLEDLPGEVSLAWKKLTEHGRAWVKATREQIAHLDDDLIDRLREHRITPLVRRS